MENKLHITTNHTGKMTGMQSLSTSCKTNPNCAKYSKVEGSVCQKCYGRNLATGNLVEVMHRDR